MNITVNGKTETIKNPCSIGEYLIKKNIIPEQVVIEYNKNIIQREIIQKIMLSNNDNLEILHFVGGGSR